MDWIKDRPLHRGELEFHLTGLRKMQGEQVSRDVSPERIEKVLAKHRR